MSMQADSSPSRSALNRRRAGRFLAGVAAAALLLAGCAPDLGPASVPKPLGAYATARSLQSQPTADWPSEAWWTAYGDPQLTALIEEALKGSPDLRAAEARVRLAEAQVQETDAERLPTLVGNGSLQEQRQSINLGYPDQFKSFLPHGWHVAARATADLSWQLDFFGKNRAALAAATSQAEAARADVAAARLQLSTQVAAAYADLVRLYADRDAAAEAVRVRRDTATLVSQRFGQGLETRAEVAQAEGNAPAAQVDVDVLDNQIAQTRNRLSALLGAGPDRGLDVARPGAVTPRPFGLPASLAADLVGRRPDVTAARLRAEAAASQTRVARLNYYPNIELTGSYGLQSLGLGDFFNHDSQVGSLGPAVHLPIFPTQRLESVYRGARAEYDQAVASYDQTLTNALRDVADAVATEHALAAQLADARAALASAEEGYRIARLRFEGGLSTYLNVLTAENGVITQRRSVADLQAQALAADVGLIRALGGGFVAGPQQHASL